MPLQAAVDMMRKVLNSVQMDGVVVIGEGEKDEVSWVVVICLVCYRECESFHPYRTYKALQALQASTRHFEHLFKGCTSQWQADPASTQQPVLGRPHPLSS